MIKDGGKEKEYMMENAHPFRTVDSEYVRQIQQYFCDLNPVYTVAVDGDGQWYNDFVGDSKEVACLKEIVKMEQLNHLYQQVAGDSIEDQVVESTEYDNVKLAAVSIKSQNKPILTWLICCVIDDGKEHEQGVIAEGLKKGISEDAFLEIVDLIRTITEWLASIQARVVLSNQAETERNKLQMMFNKSCERIEVMTHIIKLLESDEQIEEILYDLLKTVGNYLGLSSAQAIYCVEDKEELALLAEWCSPGIKSLFTQKKTMYFPKLLMARKVTVLSQGPHNSKEEYAFLHKAHMYATIILPVGEVQEEPLYLCFNECKRSRNFTVEEIKFANEIVQMTRSIFERRLQKQVVGDSYMSLRTVFDNINTCVFVRDKDSGQVLFVNKQFRDVFHVINQNEYLQDAFPEKNCDDMVGSREFYYAKQSKWFDAHIIKIKWVTGNDAYLYALTEITDMKVAQNKINEQSYRDHLTGFKNRLGFEQDIIEYLTIANSMRAKGMILCLDLDDFKYINDELGHRYGDELLKSIAYHLRTIEEVSESCYRVGGDEFVVLIPPLHYAKANLIVEHIQDMFHKAWDVGEQSYYCTMSVGTVIFPDEGNDGDSLLKKADRALAEAKRNGKNQLVQFTEQMDKAASKRLQLEKNMRDAVVNRIEEFEVYVQPIMDISGDLCECCGAEALIRWNSQELGFMPPNVFIPLAESLGLIIPMGEHVLRRACEECKYWNDHGSETFKINVNLSVIQLLQPNIVQTIKKVITEVGINPQRVTLEVTESFFIQDIVRMKNILLEIKELGIRIALDDFGTGYSSLNYVKDLPFDVIKIDRSFIQDIVTDPGCVAFLRMLKDLADNLDVNLCIEGVETMEQYEILKEMDMLLIQGFFFERPIKAKDFRKKYVEKE